MLNAIMLSNASDQRKFDDVHEIESRSIACQILGVAKNANIDAIKDAYKKLALEYHPDHNHSPDAAKIFCQIQKAYEFLSHKVCDLDNNRFFTGNVYQALPGVDRRYGKEQEAVFVFLILYRIIHHLHAFGLAYHSTPPSFTLGNELLQSSFSLQRVMSRGAFYNSIPSAPDIRNDEPQGFSFARQAPSGGS